jgi:hypothetical protein
VRWDAFFDDLEAQAAALEQANRAAEVDERARGEIAALGLLERARAAVDEPLRIHTRGGVAVAGRLRRVAPEWWLLDEEGGHEAVVATAQLVRVRGLGRYSAVPGTAGVIESRIGLRQVLRGIAVDRSPVHVHLVDGSVVSGTLDRVGADFVETATHAPAEPRRRQDVRDVELLPLRAIAVVRRSGV